MTKSNWVLLIIILFLSSCTNNKQIEKSMETNNFMIRIAELEIEPIFIDEYIAILKKESEASIRLEPGVICIFPMFQTENPNQIRLLEIYADRDAYEAHLKTPHFLEYKTSTLEMVKSLRLIDMKAIDQGTMNQIFSKIK